MERYARRPVMTGLLAGLFLLFCGVSGCAVITGRITGDIQAGITLTLSGDGTGTAVTDADGGYRFDGLARGSYILTPEKDGYTFDPESRTITLPGDDATAVDFMVTANRGAGDLNTLESIEVNMVSVPGGTFQMGCVTADSACDPDESPRHSMTLPAFEIGRFEVTQGQWIAVMADNPSEFNNHEANCPVENVSWEDVQAFITALNAQSGQNYRLCSEAEWEYAARAGTETIWSCGDNESCVDGIAVYKVLQPQGPGAVGQKTTNAWKLYDMSGNVWEWVQDWYDEDYYQVSPEDNATGPTDGDDRVCRGGGYTSSASDCRLSNRRSYYPGFDQYFLGFRLCR